ncbi:MAG: FtsX-like permease family protein [Promethearchaeota archaeon]
MNFPYFSLGSKLVLRNKRRFFVVMIGLISALTLISSVFLVSVSQGHLHSLSILNNDDAPITVYPNQFSLFNLDDGEDIRELIVDVDGNWEGVVDEVTRRYKQPFSYYRSDTHYYTFTNKTAGTVTWGESEFNTTNDSLSSSLNSFYFAVDEELDEYIERASDPMVIAGRLPTGNKEILISSQISSFFSLAINDTVNIGSTENHTIDENYTVVGIYQYGNWNGINLNFIDHFVYMSNVTFYNLITNLTGSPVLFIYQDWNDWYGGTCGLVVKVDLASVNFYNIIQFISNVNFLANKLLLALESSGYTSFQIDNEYQYYSNFLIQLQILFLILGFTGMLLAFLLPMIILSSRVSREIGNEMFERREKEFSQFRSRGFSRKQMTRILGAEVFMSSLFCWGISSTLGILVSYGLFSILNPHVAVSSFNPVPDGMTLLFYLVVMFLVSWLFVIGLYVKPVSLSFQKEMMDSLKVKVRVERRKQSVKSARMVNLVLGVIPLVIFVVFVIVSVLGVVIPMVQPAMLEYVISGMLVIAPLLIAFFLLHHLTSKIPRKFARASSLHLRGKSRNLIHVIEKNFRKNHVKIRKSMAIIMVAIFFGFMIRTLDRGTSYHIEELKQINLSGDVKTTKFLDYSDSLLLNNSLSADGNISAFTMDFIYPGYVINQSSYYFEWGSFKMHFVNISSLLNTSAYKKRQSHLSGQSWADLLGKLQNIPNAAILPSTFKSYFQGNVLNISVNYHNSTGSHDKLMSFEVIGYYNAFPGTILKNQNLYSLEGDIFLNVDFWSVFDPTVTNNFNVTTYIDVFEQDQAKIDSYAKDLGFSTYFTLSNIPSSHVLLDRMKVYGFFEFMDVDYWLILFISATGISILTFMKITKERKEIGLFRIRGFDRSSLIKMQFAEKFMPIVYGTLIGAVAGLVGGIFLSNLFCYSGLVFRPGAFMTIQFPLTILDFISLTLFPLVIYFTTIYIALRLELKQGIANIIHIVD